jgi:hypothetical protein
MIDLQSMLATAFSSGVVGAAAEIDQNLQRIMGTTQGSDRKAEVLAARNFFFDKLPALQRGLAEDYARRFGEKLAGEGGASMKTQAFSLDSLSLVEDADVDENILIANTGKRLREDCDYDFFALSRRMEIILGITRLEDNDNPAAPRTFCRCLLAALTTLGAGPAMRVHIFNASKAALTGILQRTYQGCNEFLAGKGVQIEIHKTYGKPVLSAESRIAAGPPAVGNPASTPAGASDLPSKSAAGASAGDGSAPAPAPELMNALFAQLLNQYGPGSGASKPPPGSNPGAALQALLGQLNASSAAANSSVKPGNFANTLAKLSADAAARNIDDQADIFGNAEAPAETLHAARETLADQMQPAEKMVTDLVVGMFDGILASPDLPDAVKSQIARLQLPALEEAIRDASLLTDNSHPLRILIDQLAELGRLRGNSMRPGEPLFDRVRTLLQYLLALIDSDPMAIIDVNEQLQAMIESIDLEEQRAIASLAVDEIEAERRQRALDIATWETDRRTSRPDIPDVVKLFASKAWRWLLMIDYLAGGEDSEDWKKDIATFDDLLWSVSPEAASDNRLPVKVLQLTGRLNEALNRAGVARTERAVFYTRLEEIHREVMHPRNPKAASAHHVPVLGGLARQLPDPRLRVRQRSLKLTRGAWIRTVVDGIDAQPCRLLWISPQQESHIFKNYRAASADDAFLVMSAKSLDEAFKSGRLSITDNQPLTQRSIETAVRAMLARHQA